MEAEGEAKIPVAIAMKVYVQLKFLINKQMPDVFKTNSRFKSSNEQSNINIFTQKLLDFTLARLM